ncbi:hypothetical protein [Sorangium sp. So ce385]|uniref:hypothetical protein n=1 Tax=Sorangium sp. So ce385 TaxID=3133308 RepID=UPI003F5B7654
MSRTDTKDRTNVSSNAKRQQKRDDLWPDAEKEVLDFSDKGTVGYARVPRLLPHIAALIDRLDTTSAGTLYSVLWCRDYGQGFIEVDDPTLLVFEAGYTHSEARALRTWKERMEVLSRYGFVRTKAKGSREHGYILLRNPYRAVLELNRGRPELIDSKWMDLFRSRCTDIGVSLSKYGVDKSPGDTSLLTVLST